MANYPAEPIRDIDILNAVKGILKKNPRDFLLFVLGVNTGLRISDLLSLKVADLFNNRVPKKFIRIREKKTNKAQKISINSASKKALEYYGQHIEIISPFQAVFKSQLTNKTMTYANANRILKEAFLKVGLNKGYSTHSLRKTWGYHARINGVPIEIIQKKFGHSSPQETMRYIGITQDEIEAAENLIAL